MRVLIVGAGIAGCALFRRLKPLGFTVDIIEKSATLGSEGAAICLPANAMLALDKLGLSQPVLNLAYQVDQIEYALSSGKSLASASLHLAPLNKAPFVALKRDDLMSVLREGMAEDIQLGRWPESIDQDQKGVTVTINSGEKKTYDLVVAADGINSSVRQMVQPSSAPQALKVTNWRFTAKKPVVGIQPTYYVGNDSAFMIYPISEDEVYCYGQILDERGKFSSLPSSQAIQKIFTNFASPVTECIKDLNEDHSIVLGQLKTVKHTEPVFNRVVLVGDALHGCPPSLQQGAGMSLEDINCLADCLGQHELYEALKQYQQTRSARVAWTVKESNKIIKLAGLGRSAVGRFIRNSIIRLKGPANVVGWRKLLAEFD